MPSTYTARLRLELQAAGENLNTWGAPKLNNVISRIDYAIAGRTTLALGSATSYTLTSANTDDEARAAIIDITALTAACLITVPSVSKVYVVRNQGSAIATFTTGAGSTVSVPAASVAQIFCDGAAVSQLGFAGYGLKDYIDQAILATTGSLPAVTGNAGRYIYCDGATWLPRVPLSTDLGDINSLRGFSIVMALVF